ncbi:MAG: nucleoside kinase, partial [Clostridiales bacterium]|nr:nucleoside kinase [Clostridiales bacterium]
MEYEILLRDTGKCITVADGMTFEDVRKEYIEDADDPIMLAVINGRMTELGNPVAESGDIKFLSMTSRDGKRTYRRSVIFLMQKAVQDLWGDSEQMRVLYSLGQGYFCSLSSVEMNADSIALLAGKMREIAENDLPIVKSITKTVDAEKLFTEKGMKDKARLMHFRGSSVVHLYTIDGLSNYFYGYMAPSTGYLKYFDLELYENGFMLMFPHNVATEVESFESSHQLYNMLKQSREWSRMLDL